MPRSPLTFLVVAAHVAVTAACSRTPAPPAPVAEWPDDHWAAIAHRVPGFAGWWRDHRTAVLMLVDTTKRQAALKEVAPELRDPLITSVRVQKADFDFVQLQEWKHLAISDSAVVSSDADEVRNRVVVGVVDSASVIPTRRRLLQMGIPDEALVLEVTGPSEWLDHRHGAPPNQRMKLSGRGGRPL